MSYKLLKKLDNGVRIGELATMHGKISTPFFMPVGTVGSVKGVSPKELNELGAQIVLSNTYHLYLRPGEQLIKKLGGLHQFMGWEKPILTDSGGYQVFSLGKDNFKFKISNDKSNTNDQFLNAKINDKPARNAAHNVAGGCKIENDKSNSLVKISDDGVEFKSHLDGSKHLFTPEKVIQIQLDLGVDILMPLDVCPSGKATKEEVRRACELTIAWAKRSKKYFDNQIKNLPADRQGSKANRPLLHGIVQGGLYPDLRKWCAEELIKLDFDGYSVGGLAVDLETRKMWDVVRLMGEILPKEKQRYLMGVGTPDDIIKATALGMDMFDCVLPTRMARHGSVYVKNPKSLPEVASQHAMQAGEIRISNQNLNPDEQNFKLVNLLNSEYRTDEKVIDGNCGCYACQNGAGFSKAYISHLLRSGEILGIRLTTLHNLYQYLELMQELQK